MNSTSKHFIESSVFGLKTGFVVMVVLAAMAFLAAPVFLGIVLIKSSVVATVWMYTLVGFVFGFIYKFITSKNVNIKKPEVPELKPTEVATDGQL